jgi:transposase
MIQLYIGLLFCDLIGFIFHTLISVVMITLGSIYFISLIVKETNGRIRVCLMALITHRKHEIYILVNVLLMTRLKGFEHGLDGLKEKPRSCRPCNLNEQQLSQLSQYIHDNSIKPKGGRLKAQSLAAYITQEFKVDYSIDNIYRILHQLGFSWITSRARHPKQSDTVQEVFKKIRNGNDPYDPLEYQP